MGMYWQGVVTLAVSLVTVEKSSTLQRQQLSNVAAGRAAARCDYECSGI